MTDMHGRDFTAGEFRDWVHTKPRLELYNYNNINHCAVGQFLRETGRAHDPWVGGYDWLEGSRGKRHPIPSELTGNNARGGAFLNQGTFGALADALDERLQTEDA